MGVRLIVQSGAGKGKEISLPEGEVLVGRRKGCHIRLSDARVSRQHCKITFDGTAAVVEDLDSANGTLVNGVKVKQAALKPGDLVQVGGIMFSVVSETAEVPDEAVAVMGRPPGGPVSSEQESVAGAMAAMAQAEGEGAESGVVPIAVDFSLPAGDDDETGAPTAPIPVEEDVVELAQEDTEDASADDQALEIQWEPPAEGDSDKGS